jgi:hypothetical protein
MRRVYWPILLASTLALSSGAGCRGPGYYADKSPLDIAEMVDVHLADLGPGEAGYTAPIISARRSYRLAGRKDLDSGQITHKLRLAETGSGEERYLDWGERPRRRASAR